MKVTPSYISIFDDDLRRFVYKMVKDEALTDDILQEVFIKVSQKSSQLHEVIKLRPWIYTIARNTVIDHFRQKTKHLELPNDQPVEQNYNDCVASYLQKFLPQLPDKYRHALELCEMNNLSQIEISSRLGISYSCAKSRVQRARQMLKRKMEDVLLVETDSYGNALVCIARANLN